MQRQQACLLSLLRPGCGQWCLFGFKSRQAEKGTRIGAKEGRKLRETATKHFSKLEGPTAYRIAKALDVRSDSRKGMLNIKEFNANVHRAQQAQTTKRSQARPSSTSSSSICSLDYVNVVNEDFNWSEKAERLGIWARTLKLRGCSIWTLSLLSGVTTEFLLLISVVKG